MLAAEHEPTKRHLTRMVDTVSSLLGSKLPLTALHSTIGRHAARAVRTAVIHEELQNQWQLLINNIASGDTTTYNKPTFPKGEIRGFGYHEAPRGTLSHWTVIENGKIKNYQCVVPTTWNSGPRDEEEQIGPYEASLLDNPIADPELPLEVLRTVHSFDPCMACAIHLLDTEQREVAVAKVL
jgi:hydrogenase large subunit